MSKKQRSRRKTKTRRKPARRAAKGARKTSPSRKEKRPAAASAQGVTRTPVWEIAPEQQIVGATFLGKAREDAEPTHPLKVLLEAPLAAGDTIRIKGHTTDLTQRVEHLDISGQSVPAASPGDLVALAVADRVRAGDAVYKV